MTTRFPWTVPPTTLQFAVTTSVDRFGFGKFTLLSQPFELSGLQ
jgi:hypothetical protein